MRSLGVAIPTLILVASFCRNSAAAEKQDDTLPIRRVVLYSSGVGYFERQGKVTGDETIELRFGRHDINDLLKSLVLEDLDGGKVTAVSYDASTPAIQTLKTFSIDLTGEPTLAGLLRQVRGEEVVVKTNVNQHQQEYQGTIVGIEQRKQVRENGAQSVTDLLLLMTDQGLRTIPLDAGIVVRMLDKTLNAELTEALALIAQARSTDKKSISLRCTGKGERTLRVGYIQETPVWKTSYRLLLRDDEKPFLQGWAIVENVSDHDWKDVKLNLVSGRPVSFIMDLYQPLYVARPTVQPELFAGLRPQRHGQDLLPPELGARRPGMAIGGMGGGFFGGAGGGLGGGKSYGRHGGIGNGGGMGGFGGGMRPATPSESNRDRHREVAATAPSVAQADEVGEMFRYSISVPVTLDCQKSAMLPIVNEPIAGEKLGIFNPTTNGAHPMHAFRLENVTDLHLMQGPICVLEDGEYAGDAQIADVAPKAKRLISYALDLDTEVATTAKPPATRLTQLSIADGFVKSKERVERTQHYHLKNSGDEARKILVEQPVDSEWKLATPENPTEKTRNLYRFAVDVPAGAATDLAVVEYRTDANDLALGALSGDQISDYLTGDIAGKELKAGLVKLRELRAASMGANVKSTKLRDRIDEIGTEQNRLRANMQALETSSDLYNRYVRKFGQQEDTIEALRVELAEARKQEEAAARALNEFMATLSVK